MIPVVPGDFFGQDIKTRLVFGLGEYEHLVAVDARHSQASRAIKNQFEVVGFGLSFKQFGVGLDRQLV
jgi:hypothetical protein